MIQSSSPTPPSDFMLPPPATAVVSGRNGVGPEVGSRVRISARRGGRNGVIVKTEIKDGVKKFDVKLKLSYCFYFISLLCYRCATDVRP